MTTKHRYTGFSTVDAERTGVIRYHDLDLIRIDLLNHFHTRVGERVMRPDWGCRIWDWLMDPFPVRRQQIIDEAMRIVREERRIRTAEVTVYEFQNGLRIEIDCVEDMTNTKLTFTTDFERRETARLLGA